MKEGLSELVALFDIADDTFGEMDRLETYKSINRTLGRLQEKYEGVPFRGAILYLPFIGAVPATSLLVVMTHSHGEQLKELGTQHLWEKHQVCIHGNRLYTYRDAVGGYAISFVMKYYSMGFQDAVAELLGGGISVAVHLLSRSRSRSSSVCSFYYPRTNAERV